MRGPEEVGYDGDCKKKKKKIELRTDPALSFGVLFSTIESFASLTLFDSEYKRVRIAILDRFIIYDFTAFYVTEYGLANDRTGNKKTVGLLRS